MSISPYNKIYASISSEGTSRLVDHYLQVVLFGNYLIGDMTVLPTQYLVSSINFKHGLWITFFPSKTLLQALTAIWVVALMYYNCVFPKVNICGSLKFDITCDITTNTKRINKIHKNKIFTNNLYLHLLETFCELSSLFTSV